MMIVPAVQDTRVQIAAGGHGKRFQKVGKEAGGDPADGGCVPFGLYHGVGSAGKVDGDKGQRFVHGHVGMGGAHDALTVAQSLVKRLAQHQGAILHRVVLVHLQVAAGLHLQVK